jgi:hypothetical protein
MSTAESAKKAVAGRPWPDGDPATWLYVAELPTPPEVAAEVERKCRLMRWWPRWFWRKSIERARQIRKSWHYFLGQQIVYKETPRGMLILRADEPGSEENLAFRASMAERGERIYAWWLCDMSQARDWYHV